MPFGNVVAAHSCKTSSSSGVSFPFSSGIAPSMLKGAVTMRSTGLIYYKGISELGEIQCWYAKV